MLEKGEGTLRQRDTQREDHVMTEAEIGLKAAPRQGMLRFPAATRS